MTIRWDKYIKDQNHNSDLFVAWIWINQEKREKALGVTFFCLFANNGKGAAIFSLKVLKTIKEIRTKQ